MTRGRFARGLVALGCAGALGAALPAGAGAGDGIYWTNSLSDAIRTGGLDGSGAASTLFTEPGGSVPSGIAIDPAANRIYWTNPFTGQVRTGSLDGSGAASTLFSGEGGPFGVAVDPAASRLYWAEAGPDRIRTGNLDGSGAPSTLFDDVANSDPRGVAIDPAANRIYWGDSTTATISFGNLDGSGTASPLYVGEASPNGPAIDPAAGRIYWANQSSGEIRFANLDGSGTPSTLFAGESGPVGVALDPAANRIYWGNFFTAQIRTGNLDGSGAASTLFAETGGSGSSFPALLRAPSPAGAPTITRASRGATAAAGKRKRFKPGALQCGEGSWAPDLVGAFLYRAPRSVSYEWLRAGNVIAGATSSTFEPRKRGRYSCRVTATNLAGSATQTSASKCAKRKKPKRTGGRKKKCRVN